MSVGALRAAAAGSGGGFGDGGECRRWQRWGRRRVSSVGALGAAGYVLSPGSPLSRRWWRARSWPTANTCGWRLGGRRLGMASAPAVTVGCGRRRAAWPPPRCRRQGVREEGKGGVALALSPPRQCFKTYAALLGAVCCILLAARAAAGGGATRNTSFLSKIIIKHLYRVSESFGALLFHICRTRSACAPSSSDHGRLPLGGMNSKPADVT